MLVIRSKDINKQLEEGMMEYEKVSRQILEGGTYNDPYHVEPIELTKKRQRKYFWYSICLDGQGICFSHNRQPQMDSHYSQLNLS